MQGDRTAVIALKGTAWDNLSRLMGGGDGKKTEEENIYVRDSGFFATTHPSSTVSSSSSGCLTDVTAAPMFVLRSLSIINIVKWNISSDLLVGLNLSIINNK